MTLDLRHLPNNVVYSAFTFYMLLVLLRWVGPWLEMEVEYGRFRWVARATDPLLNRLRSLLPSMGPIDFAPIAALLLLWLGRVLLAGR